MSRAVLGLLIAMCLAVLVVFGFKLIYLADGWAEVLGFIVGPGIVGYVFGEWASYKFEGKGNG